MKKKSVFIAIVIFALIILAGAFLSSLDNKQPLTIPSRESRIPTDMAKMTPELDNYPPQLHAVDEFEQPVPFDAVNTAGAEDSPFVPKDRDEFYFFFTPDVRVSVEEQILDGVTGIYMSKYVEGAWQAPERVILQDSGKLSLDGCEFVRGNLMLFCTAREGYTGMHWFSAEFRDGEWTNWRNADFPEEFDVGELHIHGNELYYHSDRVGGKGETDIWMMTRADAGSDEWKNPVNVEVVNSAEHEGMPYVSPDGMELWFNRLYLGSPATFRSKKVDGEWQEPELIVSWFAGEPTLDKDGNLYFVHHYYEDGVMLEADIYVAYRK